MTRQAGGPIRVMVVDDSAVVRKLLASILSKASGFETWTASDPLIAMRKMRRFRPDVMLLDVEMPRMDGLTFLHKLMQEDPLPVVICSGHAAEGTKTALQALEDGAVDILTKPEFGVRDYLEESATRLIDTVRGAAQARVGSNHVPPVVTPRLTADAILPPLRKWATPRHRTEPLVVLGASTGGPEALRVVLGQLPPDAPGIVVVQHMSRSFTAAFAARLDQTSALSVRQAEDGDRILRGQVLVAPGDRHIMVKRRGSGFQVELTDGPLVCRHRPSADVLFRSAAEAAGTGAVGVLLTGMGEDGAQGLLEMKQAGATTIVQDEASSIVFGMPRAAIERNAADVVVPIDVVAAAVVEAASRVDELRREGTLETARHQEAT